ncbi:MAG: Ig-like domain-containing protein [Clostridia bacterium]
MKETKVKLIEKNHNSLRSQRGVTLGALVITIIVILILSFTIVMNLDSGTALKKFNNFSNDIKVLDERVNIYVSQTGELPVLTRDGEKVRYTEVAHIDKKSVNDNGNYYIIDLSKLDNLTLSYGKGFSQAQKGLSTRDVYIINEQSYTIYYPEGVEFNGEKIYSLWQAENRIEVMPTCTIKEDLSKLVTEKKIIYTIEFSEEVEGFSQEGITITNGNKGEFKQISGSKYTIEVETSEEVMKQIILVKKNSCTSKNTGLGNIPKVKTVITKGLSLSVEQGEPNQYPCILSIRPQDIENGIKTVTFPDGTEVDAQGATSMVYTYEATKNGLVTIKATNTKGEEITKEIEITNVREFITEWTLAADNTQITLPISGGKIDTYIDWGDGTREEIKSQKPMHTYAKAGVYDIKITGTIGYWNFNSITTSKDYITGIKQWGVLDNASFSFYNCKKLVGSIPEPHWLSFRNITDFTQTFASCSGLTGEIPANLFANCSSVTSFARTFSGCSGLTGSIPATLFANCPNIKLLDSTFSGA